MDNLISIDVDDNSLLETPEREETMRHRLHLGAHNKPKMNIKMWSNS